MRAALFAPVNPDETDKIGHLAEAAIFSQWQHDPGFRNLYYARWKNEGEVDIVYLAGAGMSPSWIGEIKWSDRVAKNFNEETKAIANLLRRHKEIKRALITTRTIDDTKALEGRPLNLKPTAAYCYIVGRNLTARLDSFLAERMAKE